MSAGTLQLAERETLAPFRGACPSCGRRVLAVDVDGREMVVEVPEVLERFVCPSCAQVAALGHTRLSQCWRCGDSGWIGEALPLLGVAVDPAGRARVFTGRRRVGESVHVFHTCATRAVY